METYFYGIQSLKSNDQPFVVVMGYKKSPMDEMVHLGIYINETGNIISANHIRPNQDFMSMASALKKEAKEIQRHVRFTKILQHIRGINYMEASIDIENIDERGVGVHVHFTISNLEGFLFSYIQYKDDKSISIPYVTYKGKSYRTARLFGDAEEIVMSKVEKHPKVRLKLLYF